MDKHEIAKIFEEIAVFLELQADNPFRIRAFQNAARAIENIDEDLSTLIKEKRLKEIPGIGAGMANRITTLVRKGRLAEYEKMKKQLPQALLELMQVPGLGGKKIKLLHDALKIKTIEELAQACEAGKIAQLRGFGEKSQLNILENIKKLQAYSKRVLWWEGKKIAQPLLEILSSLKEVKKVELAGSFRRHLETVGDLDFLVASAKPEAVIECFIAQPEVAKVLGKGATKVSVRLMNGIQADLRVVTEEEFPFAFIYFTGSKTHNIKLRQMARQKGWTLNEYGMESLKKEIAPPFLRTKKTLTETEIYAALGMSYIPPELRENLGEIEAALNDSLPNLVQEKDIRGVFHCHTTYSDGHHTLDEMVKGAQDLGLEYIGITDHSKSSYQAGGMDENRLFEQIERISKLNRSKKYKIHIFSGIECDVLGDGTMDFSDEILKQLDFVIASIHRSFKYDEKTQTRRMLKAIENPYTTIIGHPTGRLLLRRDPYSIDMGKVIDACIANGKMIELNSHPNRLDMDWRLWHKAAEKGLRCCINPDAHRITDLEYYKVGVGMARKGWLTKKDIFNTQSLAAIKKEFAK